MIKEEIKITLVMDDYKLKFADELFEEGINSQNVHDMTKYKMVKEKKSKGPFKGTIVVTRTYRLKIGLVQ